MTNKVSRSFTSLTFSMKKAYQRLVTAKPSFYLLALIVAASAIFLLGGGVYNLLVQPLLAVPLQGRWIFYYPYTIHDQTPAESLTAMVMFAIGFMGLLMAYQSTRYAYKPRAAFMWLLTGTMLIVIAYIYTEFIIVAKLTTTG